MSQCMSNEVTDSTKLDGDLKHNAWVFYTDDPYLCEDGSSFTLESISISDKMKRIVLIPSEALHLLAWLQQEQPTLERLAKEQSDGGEV